MKKTMILLAGYPGTGKSYLCKNIKELAPDIVEISQDALKESQWDKYGFNNMEEKEKVEFIAWDIYYASIEENMQKGNRIISDYPFSEKQRPKLKALADKYDYNVLTLRLVADFDVLYERRIKRDLDPHRHLGHLLSCYHKGDVLEDRSQADCLVTKQGFIDKIITTGYGEFALGHTIEVDMSDFAKVDYEGLLEQVKQFID